jgi:hypothetical protein
MRCRQYPSDTTHELSRLDTLVLFDWIYLAFEISKINVSRHILSAKAKCSQLSNSTAPRILNVRTKWKRVVSFTPLPLYVRGKRPRCPVDRRLGGTQNKACVRSSSGSIRDESVMRVLILCSPQNHVSVHC